MADYDVIVLGTGGAGLTAAVTAAELGAKVGLFEKGETVGGTTVYSGGMIWIPLNMHEPAEKGDSREKALTYLHALSNDTITDEMAETYIDRGPEMVRWLHERTPVQFYAVADFPDYHPEQDGGMPHGGRSLETPLFPYGELGEWGDRVHISPYYPTYHLTIGQTTLGHGGAGAARARGDAASRRQRRARYGARPRRAPAEGLPRPRRRAADRAPCGRADRRGRRDRRRRVRDRRPGRKEVRAPNVVIATGGFERNDELKRAFLRGPCTHTVAIDTNTGDGLKMAMRAGAMLGNMREAWWMPMIEMPTDIVSTGQQLLTYERTLPGAIMVNRTGKRFTNEGANYNAFGAAFHEIDTIMGTYRNLPCWLVFDQVWLDKYGFAGGLGGDAKARTDWITSSDTLAGLADKLGIPADAFEETVNRFNANARDVCDPDFNRGWSAQDQWWGDPTLRDGTARASLGPLETAPYYAIQVFSGALGTKGGPAIDTRARVIDLDGDVIPGLYAAGNAAACPLGMTYGGAGGTLGPAMLFGYLAGRDIAERVAEGRPALAGSTSGR